MRLEGKKSISSTNGKIRRIRAGALRGFVRAAAVKVKFWLSKLLGKVIAFFGVLLTLAGVYTLASSFISMTMGDPINKDNPIGAPITITNTSSLFSLVGVSVGCDVNVYETTSKIRDEGNEAFAYMSSIPVLLKGNQDTVFCRHDSTGGPFLHADITESVFYRPAFQIFGVQVLLLPCPFTAKETQARFKTVRTSEGVKWLPYGLHDDPDYSGRASSFLGQQPLFYPHFVSPPGCPGLFSKAR
jgi:hypothetical protein